MQIDEDDNGRYTTWCADRINRTDVAYVRADLCSPAEHEAVAYCRQFVAYLDALAEQVAGLPETPGDEWVTVADAWVAAAEMLEGMDRARANEIAPAVSRY